VYYVYILQCSDGSLYTGYTVNIDKRVEKHNAGKASKYTRSRLPVHCVYLEEYSSKEEALRRELQIKNLPRQKKQAIIDAST